MVLVQKWPFKQLFFFGNIGQENVFYDILERKKAFLAYKHKKLKKSEKWHFSKGVNPKKKRLSRLKKQEVQTVEKFSSFQRG